MNSQYDIIVVGAGVAGGMFACSQKNTGRKILVIERDLTEPDRIIGELLQPGGLETLREMGLDYLTEGFHAQPVYGYTLINGSRNFTIEYKDAGPAKFGLGMRNGKFLTRIREEIKTLDHVDLIEGDVTETIEQNGKVVGVMYTDKVTGEKVQVHAPLTVVCDGPLSLFRERLTVPHKEVSSYFMGLVLRDVQPLNAGHGHMIVSGKSPVLVYPIHDNEWRILIDYPGTKPPRLGDKLKESLKNEITSLLPQGMQQPFITALQNDPLQVMPNHKMKAQANHKDGVALLGDILNMRHPLTGGGMTAVFTDIQTLNACLSKVDMQDTSVLYGAVNAYYTSRSSRVETINILANALYRVMTDDDLKLACFDYLNAGGEQATGPLSILAGMNRDKKFLLKHFFRVAMQNPSDFVLRPAKQFRLLNKAVGIIRPILKDESKPAIVN